MVGSKSDLVFQPCCLSSRVQFSGQLSPDELSCLKPLALTSRVQFLGLTFVTRTCALPDRPVSVWFPSDTRPTRHNFLLTAIVLPWSRPPRLRLSGTSLAHHTAHVYVSVNSLCKSSPMLSLPSLFHMLSFS